MQPVAVVECANELGEGCVWHPGEECLYWLDIKRHQLWRYDPETGDQETFDLGMAAGGFTIQANDDLLLFMARGAVKTWRDGAIRETLIESLPAEIDNRFNDVIADPEGRVYCGVMSTPQRPGKLYRLDPDGALSVLLPETGTSNGMGFSPDLVYAYHCDTQPGTLTRWHYDRSTGEWHEPTVLVRAPQPGGGGPDGMTVDAEGCLWSARWNDQCVVRYDPDGQEMQRILFPARKVTNIAFGGENYEQAFVTTAGGNNRAGEGPGAGALFLFDPRVQGKPEFRSRISQPVYEARG